MRTGSAGSRRIRIAAHLATALTASAAFLAAPASAQVDTAAPTAPPGAPTAPVVTTGTGSAGVLGQAEQTSLSSSAPRGPASPRGGGAQPERRSLVLAITGRYDSNVGRIDDPLVPSPLEIRGSDFRVSPTATVDYARNLGRHQVGINSTLGYDFYARNSRLNSERIVVSPYASLDLPVCDLSLSGTVSRRQSSLGDLVYFGTIEPGFTVENKEDFRRASGQVTCGDQYGLRPNLVVEYSEGRNSNPLRRIANYTSTRVQPGVSYVGPALGQISLFAVRTEVDQPNRISAFGGPGGFVSRGAGVSYRRAIGSRFTFDGSLSYIDLQPRGNIEGQNGLNAAVSLAYVASPRLQLVAFANRDFTSSLTSNAAYEINQSYGLTANYAASQRLRLRAGGSISPREFFYDSTPLGPIGPVVGEETQYRVFGGASYELNRRMRLTADTGYERRSADLDSFNYNNFFAAVGLQFRL